MPSEGQRLHGFAVVSRTLKLGRQLLVPAIFGGASAGSSLGGGAFTWILVLASLPSLLIAIGQWWAFRFRLADYDLVIDSGLLRRQRRVIPLARVQNIDLEQSFLERLVGVAELRMETASGGRETEASLQVLALGEAQELQATLLRRRAAALAERDPDRGSRPHDPATATPVAAVTGTDGRGAGTDDLRGEAPDAIPGAIPGADTGAGAATGGQPRVLLRLGLADLAIAGATSNEAGLIAAGLATLLEIAPDLLGVESLVESIGIPDLGFRGILFYGALVTVGFVVAGWLVSIAATMVRFYGFTLSRSGDDLRKEYGLFSRHRSTIPLARVQAVRIEETLLRRPLGLAALKIETAGAGPQRKEQQGGRSEAFVPLARHRDVGRLLREVFEDARLEGVPFHQVAPVSRRRSFRRLGIPLLLLTVIAFLAAGPPALALLLLLLPAWFLARSQYRARAWGRTPEYALARSGVLTRATWVIPRRKLQTLHLRESPFQRRHDIGTLLLDTAAGGRVARVVDVQRDTGAALLQDLLPSAPGPVAASAPGTSGAPGTTADAAP